MPLYNESTNLKGRGNFAPGVSYYAGIKAPKQPDVTLPKATGGFNIDLSQIGNAMIAAKESETKLGLAAVEMEENLRNAERERQFKLDLTKMEQEGQDRRLDKELANRWAIESMKNDTELLKLQKQKEAKEKDNSQTLANNAFIRSMRDASTARLNNNPNMTQERFSAIYNENIDAIQSQYPNADLAKIGEAYNKFYPGLFQYSTTSTLTRAEDMDKAQFNLINNEINASPRLQSEAKYNYAEAVADVVNTAAAREKLIEASLIEANPRSTEEQKAAAKKIAAEAGGTIAEKALIDFLMDQRFKKDIQNSSNLFRYENAIIEEGTALLMAAGDRTYGDAREYTVKAWNRLGGNAFIQGYADVAKNDKEVAEALWQTKVANNKLYFASNNQLGMFLSLPPSIQNKVLENDMIYSGGSLTDALGAYALGSVIQDKEGNYMYLRNLKTIAAFSKAEANKLMDVTGAATPEGAIRFVMLSQATNSYDKYRRREITEAGMINYSEAGAAAAQGTEDPSKPFKDYSQKELDQLHQNLSSYYESDPVGFNGVMNLCKEKGVHSPNCNVAYTDYLINKQLDYKERRRFDQSMKYIYPENFGEYFESPSLKKFAENLKGSKMIIRTFPNDDTHVGIDYIDKGVAGPAGVSKRWENVEKVLSVLNSTNTTKDQKIDYLQAWYTSKLGKEPLEVVEADGSLKETAAGVYRDWKEYMFTAVNALARAESDLIDKMSYKGDDVVTISDIPEGSLYTSKKTSDKETEKLKEKFTKDMVVKPTGNPFNEEQYPIVDNGKSISTTLTSIEERDGIYYLQPTIGDTSKHFGGYSTREAAKEAGNMIHKAQDEQAKSYFDRKKHEEWLENQPAWKQLLESFGLIEFKEE